MKKILFLTSILYYSVFADTNIMEAFMKNKINGTVNEDIKKNWNKKEDNNIVNYTKQFNNVYYNIEEIDNSIKSLSFNKRINNTQTENFFQGENIIVQEKDAFIIIKKDYKSEKIKISEIDKKYDIKSINITLKETFNKMKDEIKNNNNIKYIKIYASVKNKDSLNIITEQTLEILLTNENEVINVSYKK